MVVRAASRQIGLRAIRKAAMERQLGDCLADERRGVAAHLIAARDAADVADKVGLG
jgi:hypothetical protein